MPSTRRKAIARKDVVSLLSTSSSGKSSTRVFRRLRPNETKVRKLKLTRKLHRKRPLRETNVFIDDEAELSGSDSGSDDEDSNSSDENVADLIDDDDLEDQGVDHKAVFMAQNKSCFRDAKRLRRGGVLRAAMGFDGSGDFDQAFRQGHLGIHTFGSQSSRYLDTDDDEEDDDDEETGSVGVMVDTPFQPAMVDLTSPPPAVVDLTSPVSPVQIQQRQPQRKKIRTMTSSQRRRIAANRTAALRRRLERDRQRRS